MVEAGLLSELLANTQKQSSQAYLGLGHLLTREHGLRSLICKNVIPASENCAQMEKKIYSRQ